MSRRMTSFLASVWNLSHSLRRARIGIMTVVGLTMFVMGFVYVRSVNIEGVLGEQACYDVPGLSVSASAWASELPDLTQLLKLQEEFNNVTKDISTYFPIRRRIEKTWSNIRNLNDSTPDLPSGDIADLENISKGLAGLYRAFFDLESSAQISIGELERKENRAILELQKASEHWWLGIKDTSSALRVLRQIYGVFMFGYAERYRKVLFEQAATNKKSLQSALNKIIQRGSIVTDAASYLTEIVGPVQQSLEREKDRREDLNTVRMRLLAPFTFLLPGTVRKIVQGCIVSQSLDLDILSDLSPVVFQSLAKVTWLAHQLKMLRIDLENLEVRNTTVVACAGVDSHVEEQRALLQTAREGSHAIHGLLDEEVRQVREWLEQEAIRIEARKLRSSETEPNP